MARTTLRSALLLAGLLLPAVERLAAEEGHHWSYDGDTGPAHWSDLEHDFRGCSLGKTQSPIDIQDKQARPADLPAIRFDYHPAPLKIVDNGHTIQVNYEDRKSSISVGGHRYALLQFHFHKPSEERLNGKAYDMVAHLVHRDDRGRLAVVAVLLAGGSANPLVQTLWAHLPAQKDKESAPASVRVNAADLLPRAKGYYTFAGSLTTPPCSENVTWFVLKTPATVSPDQVERFGLQYPMNARPVQPLNDRVVRATR